MFLSLFTMKTGIFLFRLNLLHGQGFYSNSCNVLFWSTIFFFFHCTARSLNLLPLDPKHKQYRVSKRV